MVCRVLFFELKMRTSNLFVRNFPILITATILLLSFIGPEKALAIINSPDDLSVKKAEGSAVSEVFIFYEKN